MNTITVQVSRGSEKHSEFQTFEVPEQENQTVLDLITYIQEYIDPTLSYRFACRVGMCGSCGMMVNGEPRWTCRTHVKKVLGSSKTIEVGPLRNLPVIKDLVTNLKTLYTQLKSIKPWLMNNKQNANDTENIQSRNDREKLDGLYECILCACCSTSCPSYWWNSDKYLGPAVLLQSYRWLQDSRDEERKERLKELDDTFKVYRCHTIMNCTQACPKGLNPAKAIAGIKQMIAQQ